MGESGQGKEESWGGQVPALVASVVFCPGGEHGAGSPSWDPPQAPMAIVPGGGRDACKTRDCSGHPLSSSFIAESGAR